MKFEFPSCSECGINGPIQNDITGTKFCNNEDCDVWFYWDGGCVHHKGKNTKENKKGEFYKGNFTKENTKENTRGNFMSYTPNVAPKNVGTHLYLLR